MEDNREAIEQNTEKPEDLNPEAGRVLDDDIEYTFVVPKGEVYRDPDEEDHSVEADDDYLAAGDGEAIPEPVMVEPEPAETDGDEEEEEPEAEAVPAKTLVADRKNFVDQLGRASIEPPIYADTGLPPDDITYTFVVPKGETYEEPDPEEEKARKAAAQILYAETKVMDRTAEQSEDDGSGEKKTRYGLPVDHPEMGELAQKQEARRIYKQRKKNLFRTRFYVLMTAAILAVVWLVLSNSGLFTIDAIEVKGNSHYTAEEIINIGHATSGRNIIYKANIKETKEFLEQNPYIKSAEVRRKLPSTLVLKVTERQERLAFKYDDDYLVMDEEGILLKKTRNKPTTTIIEGIIVSKIKLGEKIGTEDSARMDKVLDLIKMMIKSDLYFVKVDVSKEKKIKAYIYDTLCVKTDYDTLMTNMEDGRLHLVVEKLFEDGIERGTITFLEDGSASFQPIF